MEDKEDKEDKEGDDEVQEAGAQEAQENQEFLCLNDLYGREGMPGLQRNSGRYPR
jgi:hypothetical protein